MTTTNGTPRSIVLALIDALNKEDFEKAREYTSDNMTFEGVLGKRDGADAYFEDMKKMKLKYKLQQSFEEGKDVCLFYTLDMGGANVFCAAWYQVAGDKVTSLKVVFDPRPVLAQ
ncbi:nuclear transport factor 2 family protein [Taibaiella koreensis]|uniref:nuclear transport factor 2 family protein n=1 Tax=Taibaiella koreensis TaxID=1268548 RepID=UPI000E59C5C8|nr:nuclear transport factor 2 family protein [Taibaiella koreensis]